MTDFIKETLFGVSTDATRDEAITNRPWLLVLGDRRLVAHRRLIYWIVTRKAPAGDRRPSLKADPLPPECRGAELYRTVRAAERLFDRALLEKIVLTGLISVIFAQYLLSDDVRSISVLAFVAVFVVVNAFVSQWLARRSRDWSSVAVELVGMFVVNFGIVAALLFFQRVLGHHRNRRASRHDALLRLPVHGDHRALRPVPHRVHGAPRPGARGHARRGRPPPVWT